MAIPALQLESDMLSYCDFRSWHGLLCHSSNITCSEKAFPDHLQALFHFILYYCLATHAYHLRGSHYYCAHCLPCRAVYAPAAQGPCLSRSPRPPLSPEQLSINILMSLNEMNKHRHNP